MIIQRPEYLSRLVAGQGNGLVKIVTGGRRCGKSFLLFTLFNNYLLENGVDDSHIIKLSLDDRRSRPLRDPDALLDYIDANIHADGKTNYIILDEVQKPSTISRIWDFGLWRSSSGSRSSRTLWKT